MSKFKDAMASVSIFDGNLSKTAFKALDSALDLSGGHINVAHYLPKERLKHIHSDLECAKNTFTIHYNIIDDTMKTMALDITKLKEANAARKIQKIWRMKTMATKISELEVELSEVKKAYSELAHKTIEDCAKFHARAEMEQHKRIVAEKELTKLKKMYENLLRVKIIEVPKFDGVTKFDGGVKWVGGDTSIPVKWDGWQENLFEEYPESNWFGDNRNISYRFQAGELEYIVVQNDSGLYDIYLVKDDTVTNIRSSFVYFDKDAKLFIEHYNYNMKPGEKRLLCHGELTNKNFGSDESSDDELCPAVLGLLRQRSRIATAKCSDEVCKLVKSVAVMQIQKVWRGWVVRNNDCLCNKEKMTQEKETHFFEIDVGGLDETKSVIPGVERSLKRHGIEGVVDVEEICRHGEFSVKTYSPREVVEEALIADGFELEESSKDEFDVDKLEQDAADHYEHLFDIARGK